MAQYQRVIRWKSSRVVIEQGLGRTSKPLMAQLFSTIGKLRGGTALTVSLALKEKSPLKLIDTETVSAERAMELISTFCIEHNIGILNVAGPRASKCEYIFDYVYEAIKGLLSASAPSADADSGFR